VPHYEWTAAVVSQGDGCVICHGAPGRRLIHHTKGRVFIADTWSVEFYSFSEWFTVSVDVDVDGVLQRYCNIAEPARLDGDVLSFVDLDLDLVWRRGSGWQVVDEDEFAVNAARFTYPPPLVAAARTALEGLRARVEGKGFPFDGTLDRWVRHLAGGGTAGG